MSMVSFRDFWRIATQMWQAGGDVESAAPPLKPSHLQTQLINYGLGLSDEAARKIGDAMRRKQESDREVRVLNHAMRWLVQARDELARRDPIAAYGYATYALHVVSQATYVKPDAKNYASECVRLCRDILWAMSHEAERRGLLERKSGRLTGSTRIREYQAFRLYQEIPAPQKEGS